ncbi:MAG: hypothetical protein OSJ54_06130 [Oscillospiraceae bacterium]|nr:hypothetical protein [Oscillospiraceae bacterium]
MNDNENLKVATPATMAAFKEEADAKYSTKAEVDRKISEASFGGISITPITAEEIKAMFAADSSETA